MVINLNSAKQLKKHTNLNSEGQIHGSNFYINSLLLIEKTDGFLNSSTNDLDVDINIPTKTILLKYIGTNPNFTFDNRKIIGCGIFGAETTGFLHKVSDQYGNQQNLKEIIFKWDLNFNEVNATGYKFSVAKFQTQAVDSDNDLICVACSRHKMVANSTTGVSLNFVSGDNHSFGGIEYSQSQARSMAISGDFTNDPLVRWGTLESGLSRQFMIDLFTVNGNGLFIKNFEIVGVPTVAVQWDFDSNSDRTNSYFMVVGLKKRRDLQESDPIIFIIKHISYNLSNRTNYELESNNVFKLDEEDVFLSLSSMYSQGTSAGVNGQTSGNIINILGSFHLNTIKKFDENSIIGRKNFYALDRIKTLENNLTIDFINGLNDISITSTVPTLDMDTCFFQLAQKQANTSTFITADNNVIGIDEPNTSGTVMRIKSQTTIIDDGLFIGIEFWAIDLTLIAFQKASNVAFCTKFLKEHKVPFFFHKLLGGGSRFWGLIQLFNTIFKTTSKNKIGIKNVYDLFIQEQVHTKDGKTVREETYTLLNAMYSEFSNQVLLFMQKTNIGFDELDESIELEEYKESNYKYVADENNKTEMRKILNNRIKHLIENWEIKKLNRKVK